MGVADDASISESDDARGVLEQALIMGGEDESETQAAVQVAHQVNELGGILSVEIGGGFIGQDEGRAMDDGPRDGYPLTLAARKEVGTVAGARRKANIGEGFGDTLTAFAGFHTLNQQWVLDIFASGKHGDEVEGLKDEADLLPAEERSLGRAELRSVSTVDEDVTAGGLIDAANEIEQGRFPAAAGTGDGEEFASIDAEAHIVEGGDGVVVERKSPGNLFNADK